ncbi:uncharacterized protein LOC126699367 [Quercus robur]|uniref:uncharacterized protein LOC126699367 n=1 Tax=Quercus robur TaxID=38942 RepID=UPI002163C1F2|nr:uncharacterized protein LOC126699367 [Quercus robur]
MGANKFVTWGFLFILMFLLVSEAASRKLLETSELGNSKVKKGGVVLPTPPNPGTHIVGYGYDQSKKSSTIEAKKPRGPVTPTAPNPRAFIPTPPAAPGSQT